MNEQRVPTPVVFSCVLGVGLLVVGQSVAGLRGSLADVAGAGVIGGSLFIPAWQRASAAATHDEQKRKKLAALNRRLLVCLALAMLALACLDAMFGSLFRMGDMGVLLGIIPLLVLTVVVVVAAFTAMSVCNLS